ncbi:MAG: hypothetical protein DLM50_01510, partial [Candidatus Meridianibacter frigidus]
IATVYRECEDAVLRRLDIAMQAFFRRCSRGKTPGFPRFKPASRWKQIAFPHGNRALKFDTDQKRVRVPGVGEINLRKGRAVPEVFGRGWLVEKNDRWYLCVEHEVQAQPKREIQKIVGIDRGVHVLAATSDGALIANLAVAEKRKRATARLLRQLDARTVKSSDGRCLNRPDPVRIVAAKCLARAKEREANARRDYAHKVSRKLVDSTDCIGIEALLLVNMTRSAKGTVEQPGVNVRAKAGLNRVMLDSGFGLLQQMIAYKAESAGVKVVAVNPAFSSQECSNCGSCERGSRRRRRYVCLRCGYCNHADVNAALVIRGRAQLALLRMPDDGADPVRLYDAA